MSAGPQTALPRTLILGGGIAGLEALLALHDLAAGRTEVTLIAPEPQFTYKPLIVEEPFSFQPAARRELDPAIRELGGRFVLGVVEAVHPENHAIVLSEGDERRYVRELPYDLLVVCVGGRSHAVYKHAVTFRFRSVGDPLEVDALIAEAEAHDSKRLAFVVPPGVGWTLPLYELALLTRLRAEQTGRRDLRLTLVTPEESPLVLFGKPASEAVAKLLRAREIEFRGGTSVHESEDGLLHTVPSGDPIVAGAFAALPVIEGPRLAGLPFDERGFIPIDEHARVTGVEDVYAAGDGTNFPIKQGGLGTQQADAAAEHIAARLGAGEPKPFHPVLRGKLLTGAESLGMRHDLGGGQGEGVASTHHLWWPPDKVGGRYLAPWLARRQQHTEVEPPPHLIDVEVALPGEWQDIDRR